MTKRTRRDADQRQSSIQTQRDTKARALDASELQTVRGGSGLTEPDGAAHI